MTADPYQWPDLPTAPAESRWTILGPAEPRKGIPHVLARCRCGTERVVCLRNILRRHSKSCGCLATEIRREMHTTHGLSDRPEHGAWMAMIRRCEDPKHVGFKSYGARGIQVCERWHDFANFYADMGPRPDGMSLDRIDGDGNYEPGNCRWATASEQAFNKRPRTHCKHGHEFTPENTGKRRSGRRLCRTCAQLRSERRKAQREGGRSE